MNIGEKIMSEEEFLKNYDYRKYPRPSVTVDIVVFGVLGEDGGSYRKDEEKSISLLLVKRGGHPFMGKWALPGGFLREDDESVEKCAEREIFEETNVKPRSLMPIGTFSGKERDPRGWIISNAFVSVVEEDCVNAHGGDDAEDARWFKGNLTKIEGESGRDLYKLEMRNGDTVLSAILEKTGCQFGRDIFKLVSGDDFAFDHALIIATAFSMLRKVAEDFDVLFDFLPEKFTLTSLQKVQETILGVPLLAANFRRKIEKLVVETDEYTSGAGHRPAKLFRKRV